MFKKTAERFYLRVIKVPASMAKIKHIKKINERHDYDMIRFTKIHWNKTHTHA